MVVDAGLMVQFVLMILMFFSIVSWAIIFTKYLSYRKIKNENDLFFEAYLRSKKLSDVFTESKLFKHSTVAEVFRAAYTELSSMARSSRDQGSHRREDSSGGTLLRNAGHGQYGTGREPRHEQ